MCDRYSFALPKEKIIRRFSVKVIQTPEAHYNISPGHHVPIITQATPTQLTFASWGIYPLKPADKVVHALSAEQLTGQAHWKNLLAASRCLMIADGFYLWKKVSKKGKVPFRVALKWNLPFAFAGVYTQLPDASVNCLILSVAANELIRPLQTTMPAILPMEHEQTWLNPDILTQEALAMLTPFPADRLKMFPVSAQLHNPHVNSSTFTQPAQPTDQFGNFVLFSED